MILALLRDLRTGFYQVEIPAFARHLFRFQTDDGSWFELLRLPMGHCCAPEIMHTLTACVAGDPSYVRAECAAQDVQVHIWVDNVRYTGTQEAICRESSRLDTAAQLHNVTWKAAESFTNVKQYDFIGVYFNHHTHTVRPTQKLLKKVALSLQKNQQPQQQLSAGELESLAGRLVHASAIADISDLQAYDKLVTQQTLAMEKVCSLDTCVLADIAWGFCTAGSRAEEDALRAAAKAICRGQARHPGRRGRGSVLQGVASSRPR